MEWIKTYSLDHLNDICNMDEDRGALRSARPSLFTGPTPEPAFFRHFAANRADGSFPAGGLCRPPAEEIPARTAINLRSENGARWMRSWQRKRPRKRMPATQ